MSISESELNSEFYYHGTGKKYFESQIKKYGKYMHDTMPNADTSLFIGRNRIGSENYAKDRARRHFDSPILLIIEGNKIRGRIREHKVICDLVVDFLDKCEFKVKDIKLE